MLARRTLRGLSTPRRLQTPLNSAVDPRRSFHLSTLADAVVLTADSISFIHHAGLPWPLTIPLLALGVNISLRLPLQFYTRRLVLQRNQLTPLIHAWSARHAAASIPPPPPPHSSSSSGREQQLWRLRVAGLTERSRKRIYKTWRVQRWKSLAPLLSMAPFVIVTEALRRLCGAPLGWLGRSSGLGASMSSSSASSMLDPCLAEGGCLWFVDLTAMDPYYALPLLCSALLVRSTWGRLPREQLRTLLSLETGRTPVARVQAVVGRTLLLMPLFPVLFADLPSAIFLYWATAFALTEVSEAILGRVLPKREARLTSTPKGRAVMPYLRGTGHRPNQ